jgi:hypothetical protein
MEAMCNESDKLSIKINFELSRSAKITETFHEDLAKLKCSLRFGWKLIKSKYKLQFLSSSSFNVKGASVLALSPQNGSINVEVLPTWWQGPQARKL